jgi:hypothetical protein
MLKNSIIQLDPAPVILMVVVMVLSIATGGANANVASQDFVTTWQTTSPSELIIIPVDGAPGTYTVDWGDGIISSDVTGDRAHIYDNAGTICRPHIW